MSPNDSDDPISYGFHKPHHVPHDDVGEADLEIAQVTVWPKLWYVAQLNRAGQKDEQ